MARRKNSKCSVINKQKTLITSRLMQISLKVDDYIYKDIPISVRNAVLFIKEVSGFKDKCFEDKRALQVIEKLTRVMKGIIAEQQESQQGGNQIDVVMKDPTEKQKLLQKGNVIGDVIQIDVETILASTVDDDLTQFTQGIDMEKRTQKNSIEIVHLCDNRSDSNKHVTPYNAEKEKFIHTKKDVNLVRALSELSINVDDDDDPLSLTHFNLDECSQSILSNYDCLNNDVDDKRAKTNVITCSQDFEEVIQPAKIRKSRVNDTTNTKFDKISVTTTKRLNNKVNSANKSNLPELLASKAQNNLKTNKKTVEEKNKIKRGLKSTLNIGNNNKKKDINCNFFDVSKPLIASKTAKENVKQVSKAAKTKASKKKESLSKPIVLKQYERISISEKKYNFLENIHKTDMEQKLNVTVQQTLGRVNEDLIQTTAEKRPKSQSVFTQEHVHTIYSKEVENDLSWVESIRYVREITQEEGIPVYLEDSFWDDYTLPNNWNDEDFLYI